MDDLEATTRTIVVGGIIHTHNQSPSSGCTPYDAKGTGSLHRVGGNGYLGGDPNVDDNGDEDDSYNADRDKDKYHREFTLVQTLYAL